MFRAFQDMDLSLWQSAVAEVFQEGSEEERKATIEATSDYCELSFAAEGDISTTELLERLGDKPSAFTSAVHHRLATAQLFLKHQLESVWTTWGKRFEEGKDWRWKRCVDVYKQYRAGQTRDQCYRPSSKSDFSVIDDLLSKRANIAIIGDWGTGEPEAIKVLRAAIGEKPDFIIHLGDIYYSGTQKECSDSFHDPVRKGEKFSNPVFTLAGNHDYYAAGTGFYWLIEEINKNCGTVQEASYFCLRNGDWQLLAMDTAYNDAVPVLPAVARKMGAYWATSLRPDEIYWHLDKLQNAARRKTILLSHHQLYSAYDKIGIPRNRDSSNSSLYQTFAPFFGKDKICAWLWGHEHDHMTFDPFYHDLPLGICIGHGAIPVRCSSHPKKIPSTYDGLPKALKKHSLNSTRGYYNNGFSVLRLDGLSADIEHFEVDPSGVSKSIGSDTIS